MGKVIAGNTTSVDGYVAGPADGPGCGVGKGGERLHSVRGLLEGHRARALFSKDIELEHKGVRPTRYATFIDYAVKLA